MSQQDNLDNEQHEITQEASGTVIKNAAIEIFSQ